MLLPAAPPTHVLAPPPPPPPFRSMHQQDDENREDGARRPAIPLPAAAAAACCSSPVVKAQRDKERAIGQLIEITHRDRAAAAEAIERVVKKNGDFSLEDALELLLEANCPPSEEMMSDESPRPTDCVVRVEFVAPQPAAAAAADHRPFVSEMKDEIAAQLMTVASDPRNSAPANHPTRRDGPAGLRNLGNTCWFNSVVQALFAIPQFRNIFMDFAVPAEAIDDLGLDEKDKASVRLLMELRRLFTMMMHFNSEPINPGDALLEFKPLSPFEKSEHAQQDASEALNHLIDQLENAIDVVSKHIGEPYSAHVAELKQRFTSILYGKFQSLRNGTPNGTEVFREVNIPMCAGASELNDSIYSLWLGLASEDDEHAKNVHFERWISEEPEILFICLNRYKFSSESKKVTKVVTSFAFPPELYLDRFMMKNREVCLTKWEVEADLRQRRTRLLFEKECLEQMNMSGVKLPANCLLNMSVEVVDQIIDVLRIPVARSRDSDFARSAGTTREFLRRLSQMVVERKIELDREIDAVSETLDNLYASPALMKHKYDLHAICVHRGVSNRGHYWTHVRDSLSGGQWYRCNDSEVHVALYDDVYADSLGSGATNPPPPPPPPDDRTGLDEDERRQQLSAESTPCAYLLIYAKRNSQHGRPDHPIPDDIKKAIQSQLEAELFANSQEAVTKLANDLICDCEEPPPTLHPAKSEQDPVITSHSANVMAKLLSHKMHNTHVKLQNLLETIDQFIHEVVADFDPLINRFHEIYPKYDVRLESLLSYLSVINAHPDIRRLAIIDMLKSSAAYQHDSPSFTCFQLRTEIIYRENMSQIKLSEEYREALCSHQNYLAASTAAFGAVEALVSGRFQEAIQFACIAHRLSMDATEMRKHQIRGIEEKIIAEIASECFECWFSYMDAKLSKLNNNPKLEAELDESICKFIPCARVLAGTNEKIRPIFMRLVDRWRGCSGLFPMMGAETKKVFDKLMSELVDSQCHKSHTHSIVLTIGDSLERYQNLHQWMLHRERSKRPNYLA